MYKVDEEDVEDIEADNGLLEIEGMDYKHVGFRE